MADFDLPDEIIGNILVRLDVKQLLRCRCVSTHWNNLILDPSFMNIRSRPQILFLAPHLYLLNENAPVKSLAKLDHYPFNENQKRDVTMLGTFNGLVFFAVCDVFGTPINTRHMPAINIRDMLINTREMHYIVIYNPVTRASKVVPDPYSSLHDKDQAYGLAYGSTDDDDLKIVKFGRFKHANNYFESSLNFWNTCNVLDLKTCSWSSSDILLKDIGWGVDHVATFLDGFLYWITYTKIIALHVKKMAVSERKTPGHDRDSYYSVHSHRLGTLHGRLCVVNNNFLDAEFHLWIMKKEDNSWSKGYLFTLQKEVSTVGPCIRVMSVLDDGRIVMINYSGQVIVYDLLKHSSKILSLGSSIRIHYVLARCAAYMETLVSPSDICRV